MNRRRVLQVGAALGSVGFAGCVDGVAEHFTGGIQGVIPMEIHSEAEEPRNLHFEAHDRETDQQIYEEGITVGAGESVYPSHLRGTDQFLRVAEIDTDEGTELDAQQAAISEDTRLVLIRVYDEEIEIELQTAGDDQETVEDQDASQRETIDDPEDATEFDDDDLEGTNDTADGSNEETDVDEGDADALES
ncbi:hypothetical protein [Natrarchaeobaculum aegyptiacum]|uniref:Uncharacterized protein n=1 Tax=Natrarchaeobaculum aegyptiacum TaxID=745377 RepID=A0A2Z2HYA3_9EURY|nr:hypothetical protein [Natrarchaeobaculum aegyptiacum]ARS88488.1 hypothetical protein B1756_01115 [Natrarchaeobaculum aegyptiacum]